MKGDKKFKCPSCKSSKFRVVENHVYESVTLRCVECEKKFEVVRTGRNYGLSVMEK